MRITTGKGLLGKLRKRHGRARGPRAEWTQTDLSALAKVATRGEFTARIGRRDLLDRLVNAGLVRKVVTPGPVPLYEITDAGRALVA